jgi:hypothetical protein
VQNSENLEHMKKQLDVLKTPSLIAKRCKTRNKN